MAPAQDGVPVHAKDTWSSLAMKHYGDALLGVRLAEANGVPTTVPPAQVDGLHLPPVEELDPDRLAQGPGPGADLFADDEASVVKEARYRMVMAMGGSGAVNAAPPSVSSKKAEAVGESREEKRDKAKERDLGEGLGERDGQALVLDVKPSIHKQAEAKKSTKDNLHKDMSARDGKELILEVKAGGKSARKEGGDHLGDSLAAKDGRAYIVEVKAAVPRQKKTEIDADGNEREVEEEEVTKGPPMGERFGDEIAKIDGKALILESRAHTARKETKEQLEAKKKNKATAKLFGELADRDGKELVLDVRAQVKDEAKFNRLKERRKLAKKRKRRTGSGSLIPTQWQAQGDVSVDQIEDYLDELRDTREAELELYGEEDTATGTLTRAKAAQATHHRSQAISRASFSESTEEGEEDNTSTRPLTEGFGAYDDMHERLLDMAPASAEPRPKRKKKKKKKKPKPEALADTAAEPKPLPHEAPGALRAHPQMSPPKAPTPKPRPKAQPKPQPQTPETAPMRNAPAPHPQAPRPVQQVRADRPRAAPPPVQAQQVSNPLDWDDDDESRVKLPGTNVSDWDDDEESAAHLSGLTGLSNLSGLSGISKTTGPSGPLPSVSASDPYAPEAMARLCMLSPGTVMQVARAAPVGAGPVLELIGNLREAKNERDQADMIKKFINTHREDATRTLELLLTT